LLHSAQKLKDKITGIEMKKKAERKNIIIKPDENVFFGR